MKLIRRQERDTPNSEDNKVVVFGANTDDRVAEMEKKLAEMQKMLAAKDEKIAKLEGAKESSVSVLDGKEYKIFIKSNFYANINTSVVNDARLNDKSDVYAKLLYVVLCEQTIKKVKVTISNNLLAVKINASVTTVKKAVNRLESLGYINVERSKESKEWNAPNKYSVNHVVEFPIAEHSAFFDSAKKFIERHSDEIEKLGTNELHFRRWTGTKFTDPDIVLDPEYHNVEGITGNKFQKADINEITGEFKANNSKKKRGKEDDKQNLMDKRNFSRKSGLINENGVYPCFDSNFREKYKKEDGTFEFNENGKTFTTKDPVIAEGVAFYLKQGKNCLSDVNPLQAVLKFELGFDVTYIPKATEYCNISDW